MQTIRERLLSDENIYLSIYLAHSYVQNKELLRDEDLKLLNEITDVFCLETISTTTKKVKERIEQVLLKPDEFFDVIVYFKPKKYENGKTSFRPLHTTELIDQIAMIAMLQVLVYDIEPKTNKLLPSELSRLIPSDFYGIEFLIMEPNFLNPGKNNTMSTPLQQTRWYHLFPKH